MIKQLLVTGLLLFLSNFSLSQRLDTLIIILPADTITYWDNSGSVNINFSQVNLSNWAGGGLSSLSTSGILKLKAAYEKEEHNWDNEFGLAYGVIKQKGNKFKKTDDNLQIKSSYGMELKEEQFLISSFLDFRTQIDKGFKYEKIPNTDQERKVFISDFLAPGYLLSSVGMTYKKKDFYSFSLSPFTGKFTMVYNDSLASVGSYGVKKGNHLRSEAGANVSASFDRELMKNIKLSSNVNFFSNYKTFGNIDVNCEALLLLKVNKYISSSVSAQLIYDDDIEILQEDGTSGPETQFKNVINVGFDVAF